MSNEERVTIVHTNTIYSYQRQRNKLVNYPLRSGPLRACKSFPTRYVLAFVQNLVENGQKNILYISIRQSWFKIRIVQWYVFMRNTFAQQARNLHFLSDFWPIFPHTVYSIHLAIVHKYYKPPTKDRQTYHLMYLSYKYINFPYTTIFHFRF